MYSAIVGLFIIILISYLVFERNKKKIKNLLQIIDGKVKASYLKSSITGDWIGNKVNVTIQRGNRTEFLYITFFNALNESLSIRIKPIAKSKLSVFSRSLKWLRCPTSIKLQEEEIEVFSKKNDEKEIMEFLTSKRRSYIKNIFIRGFEFIDINGTKKAGFIKIGIEPNKFEVDKQEISDILVNPSNINEALTDLKNISDS
ncbi:hypothetical protein ACFLUV_02330 [Elusimicrobiota bacterium]